MKLVSQYTILYGKRLFAATVLVGVLVQVDAFLTFADLYPGLFPNDTLGLIVPGLIAYQVGKQRVLPTLVSLISVAAASGVLLTVGWPCHEEAGPLPRGHRRAGDHRAGAGDEPFDRRRQGARQDR